MDTDTGTSDYCVVYDDVAHNADHEVVVYLYNVLQYMVDDLVDYIDFQSNFEEPLADMKTLHYCFLVYEMTHTLKD